MATTTSMPAPEAQSQPAISPIGRIIGVFFSPKTTFEDIVRKPSWVLPVALLTLFSIGVSLLSDGLGQAVSGIDRKTG